MALPSQPFPPMIPNRTGLFMPEILPTRSELSLSRSGGSLNDRSSFGFWAGRKRSRDLSERDEANRLSTIVDHKGRVPRRLGQFQGRDFERRPGLERRRRTISIPP